VTISRRELSGPCYEEAGPARRSNHISRGHRKRVHTDARALSLGNTAAASVGREGYTWERPGKPGRLFLAQAGMGHEGPEGGGGWPVVPLFWSI
jgi:hypothetical protein